MLLNEFSVDDPPGDFSPNSEPEFLVLDDDVLVRPAEDTTVIRPTDNQDIVR